MISTVIKQIGDQLQALDWVDVYGGLVQTIRIRQGEAENETYNVFPISCDVSDADCVANQRYQDLVPDDSKASILYFETLNGLQDVGPQQIGRGSTNRFRRVFRGAVRLVGWLNMQKLGVTECNGADMAVRSILKILNEEYNSFPAGSLLENANLRFNIQRIVPKDHRVIFGRYNYLDSNGYWLYPFDFFAVDLGINLILPLCDYEFPTNGVPIDPDDCVDYSRIL